MNKLPGFFLFVIFLALFLTFVVSCEDEDSSTEAISNSDDDDLSAVASAKVDDDTNTEEMLQAAAIRVDITPNESNHPETIYLGGIFPPRLATEVHDEIFASVLHLKQGQEEVVLVSLDLLGFTRSRIRQVQERLAEHGLPKEQILIASTHTHEGPDTLGVFGPNVLTSGVSPTYMQFVQDSIVDAVLQTRENLVPVTMRAGSTQVNFPLSNHPTLMDDFRQPEITVPWLSAASFEDDQGEAVATLVNWHAHPEVMIQTTVVSSDFPKWTREKMEDTFGGTCVYISGAVGGLASPTGVDVPGRDENGNPLLDENQDPIYLQEATWDKTRSLGFVIAELAADAIEGSTFVSDPQLSVVVQPLLLPVNNIVMMLAYLIGLVEFDEEDRISDQPEYCGFFGCSDDRIALMRLGPITLVTSPGETFPETVIGREEFVYDFGDPWGEFTFPAMEGIQEYMDSEVPMHMGICGNEVGYLIPEADFHPREHPDYYEEDLFWGYDTETIYREAAIELLQSK